MGYNVPAMPLKCNVWSHGSGPPAAPRITELNCNLAWGKRVAVPSTGGTSSLGVPLFTMVLLVPALSDLRGRLAAGGSDVIECPADSGRMYECVYVDDLGKGFANEHRGALLLATAQPTPLP